MIMHSLYIQGGTMVKHTVDHEALETQKIRTPPFGGMDSMFLAVWSLYEEEDILHE